MLFQVYVLYLCAYLNLPNRKSVSDELGNNTAETENRSLITIITIITYSSAFVPIVYIIFSLVFGQSQKQGL